jgi:RNA recognition motif-containing protein
MQIFVGNLAYTVTTYELREAFEAYGVVDRVQIPLDPTTGSSRGYGFVQMPDEAEAQAAIAGLDGTRLGPRPVRVSAALPRGKRAGPERPR